MCFVIEELDDEDRRTAAITIGRQIPRVSLDEAEKIYRDLDSRSRASH